MSSSHTAAFRTADSEASSARACRTVVGLVASALVITAPRVTHAADAPSTSSGGSWEAHCHEAWFDVLRCRDAPDTSLRVVLAADLGLAKMTESGPLGFRNGVGSVTDAGPSWGVRAGVEFLPWIAIEVRYAGARMAVQGALSPGGSTAYVLSVGDLTLRLTAPLPWVRPYVFGGVGYADVALSGSQEAKAASSLFSSSQLEIPMGLGVDIPLTWHLSIGAEATYHFQWGESYSNDTNNGIDGGDIDTFEFLVRARL